MALWFILGLMTVAAVAAVLWPLGRRSIADTGGSETAVYKDQLAEIDRDRLTGLIGVPEAAAARVEIGRRLLAAADVENEAPAPPRQKLRRAVSVVALVGLPLLAGAMYLDLGSPSLADFPLSGRAAQQPASASLDTLVAQVEAHLEKNPRDARGWQVLAPVLFKLGRYDDAVRALRNCITFGGDTAELRGDLGEAISAAAGGVVTIDAKAEFERAVLLNPEDAKARYFLGVAAEQDGRTTDAATAWRTMLAGAPPDAPWRPLVQSALARVSGAGGMPTLSDSDVASAKSMTTGDQNEMIRGMVDRLSTKLKQNGGDVEGWLRLVRAYMVLGDTERARATTIEARQAVASDAIRLKKLNDGLKGLGLDG